MKICKNKMVEKTYLLSFLDEIFYPSLISIFKLNFKIVRHGTKHMISFVTNKKGEKQ